MLKVCYVYDVQNNIMFVPKIQKKLLFQLPYFDQQVPDCDHSESFLKLDSLVGYFYGSFPYCFHAVCVSIQQCRDDPW